MKINCVIIDDEPLAISVLESYINKLSNVTIVDTYTRATDAIIDANSEDVDVIFLDINMPNLNGLDFLKSMGKGKQPLVVITTAYREYALESFDFNVIDYLVKPIPFERFLKSINKVSERLMIKKKSVSSEKPGEPYFFVKVDKKMVRIQLNEILYIESLKDYIKIKTIDGSYIVYQSLSGILMDLPSENFIRIHRSFIIAIDKVASVEGTSLEIAKKSIPIGRSHLKEARERILGERTISTKNKKHQPI
nr:LytTR family DNA-binding domain-containing protein [uncultured Allomuricauda sp.]